MYENEVSDLIEKLEPNYGMLPSEIITKMLTFNKEKRL